MDNTMDVVSLNLILKGSGMLVTARYANILHKSDTEVVDMYLKMGRYAEVMVVGHTTMINPLFTLA